MSKVISNSLSPNTEADDIRLARRVLFSLWTWQKGRGISSLEEKLKKQLNLPYVFLVNSGRTALEVILESLSIGRDCEVITQGFTCNAQINPIRWSGATPIYADIDETLNIDPQTIKAKITTRTKAVLAQHTFGFSAQIDKIKEICRENNLLLIEDCAHSLGASINGKQAGTFGDVSFFSFGRDKVISSVFGGAIATADENIALSLSKNVAKLPYPSLWWIKQQLLHPILFSYILPRYFGIGRYLLVAFQKLGLLSKAVTAKENEGEKPGIFPRKCPNALAVLAGNQLEKLERFNIHRKRIAEIYFSKINNGAVKLPKKGEGDTIYMRFPILVARPEDVFRLGKENGILFDDGWTGSPIVPKKTKLEKMCYTILTSPKAEYVSQHLVNLPTNINVTEEDAQKIVDLINSLR